MAFLFISHFLRIPTCWSWGGGTVAVEYLAHGAVYLWILSISGAQVWKDFYVSLLILQPQEKKCNT